MLSPPALSGRCVPPAVILTSGIPNPALSWAAAGLFRKLRGVSFCGLRGLFGIGFRDRNGLGCRGGPGFAGFFDLLKRFLDLFHVKRRLSSRRFEKGPALLDFDDVESDTSEKEEDRANARSFGQKGRCLGPEKRLDIAAEA